jgi:plastocyanin
MNLKQIMILSGILSVFFLGAGCAKESTMVTNLNVNTSVNAPANTNSRTTGIFTTSRVNINTNSATPRTQIIYITASGLDRSLINISAGQSVEIINNDSVIHRMYARSSIMGVNAFDANLSPGESTTHRFTEAGTYALADSLDASSPYWHGQIVVK